jgi:membrane-associated phospholipid phosphatase
MNVPFPEPNQPHPTPLAPALVTIPRPAARSSPVRLLAALGPDYTLFFVFLFALIGLGLAYGVHWVWKEGPIYLSAASAVIMVLVRFTSDAGAILTLPSARREFAGAASGILRDFGPLFLVAIVFENLETYTGLIRQAPIDDALYQMDLALFGVEPTVWMSRLDIPILTDWFALAYGLYLITPLVLAVFLLARGRRHDFREMSTAVIIQMCVGFVLFVLFPAGPPRFYEALIHPTAGTLGFDPPMLHSFFGLYEFQQGGFDTVDPLMTRSAFPSLHCSLGLLTIVYGWRFSDAVVPRFPRLFFWVALPLAVSLWLSTVYLRHHWLPDIAAGLALGTFACWASPALRRNWPRVAVTAMR